MTTAPLAVRRTGSDRWPWQVCYTDPTALDPDSLAAELDGSCWPTWADAMACGARILDLLTNGEH